MEIKDVIEVKKQLAKDIASLVISFEKATETKVSCIYLRSGEKLPKEKINVTLDV